MIFCMLELIMSLEKGFTLEGLSAHLAGDQGVTVKRDVVSEVVLVLEPFAALVANEGPLLITVLDLDVLLQFGFGDENLLTDATILTRFGIGEKDILFKRFVRMKVFMMSISQSVRSEVLAANIAREELFVLPRVLVKIMFT